MGRSVITYHDSLLGRWTRALYFPDAPLREHIEMLWYVAGRADYARDRRLPTGRAHLLFNLATPPLLFDRNPTAAPRAFPTCWLAGQQETYIETGSCGDTVLLGAQFSSHGAWRLLRVAQHELDGEVVELEALLGDRILRLRERMLAAATPQACFELLEHWLLGLLQRPAGVHANVLAVQHAAMKNPGEFDLMALSRDLGVSREHLIRRFREQVGLTPKAYANILRFNRTLKYARHSRGNWSEIAQDCGYYDQAHLIRDFQRYAGRAPTSLLHDRMPDADSVVIA